MAAPITIPLSAGQAAVFASLDQQERDAQIVLVTVPAARNAAAMVIAVASYTVDQVHGQRLAIDLDANTLTFVPNDVPPPPPAE